MIVARTEQSNLLTLFREDSCLVRKHRILEVRVLASDEESYIKVSQDKLSVPFEQFSKLHVSFGKCKALIIVGPEIEEKKPQPTPVFDASPILDKVSKLENEMI